MSKNKPLRLPISIKEAIKESSVWVKILLWGDSGSGKTHASATIGSPDKKVLICCAEVQGKLAIANSNKDALVYGVASTDDLYNFIKLIKQPNFKEKYNVDSIVFDGLTEIQRLFSDEIKAKRSEENNGAQVDTLQMQEYNILLERMLRFLRFVRNLEYHVVCTALSVRSETSNGVKVEPMFVGKKLPNLVSQFFNIVGYMKKVEVMQEENKILQHRVILNTSSAYITKGTKQLDAVEEPNLRKWLKRIMEDKESVNNKPFEEEQTTRRRRR